MAEQDKLEEAIRRMVEVIKAAKGEATKEEGEEARPEREREE